MALSLDRNCNIDEFNEVVEDVIEVILKEIDDTH